MARTVSIYVHATRARGDYKGMRAKTGQILEHGGKRVAFALPLLGRRGKLWDRQVSRLLSRNNAEILLRYRSCRR